ncbi:MAG: hypothetical protein ABGX53_02540 [Candidatus Thioglobus sp.]|jgi:hypothetical protein
MMNYERRNAVNLINLNRNKKGLIRLPEHIMNECYDQLQQFNLKWEDLLHEIEFWTLDRYRGITTLPAIDENKG